MTDLMELASRVEAATEWRLVPGWQYEASDTGVIRNAVTRKPLRPHITPKGYERVTFQTNNQRRDVRVHRAIYEAWKGPIPENAEINHLNGIKSDNRPTNLEACSRAENIRHSVEYGLVATGDRNGMHTKPESRLRGSMQTAAKLSERDIPIIRQMIAARQISQAEIGRRFGVSRYLISKIAKGKGWNHVEQ